MILTGEEGEGGRVDIEDLERLRSELGLDRPIYVQYGEWVFNLLKGDLGTSIWYRIPVMDELKDRFIVSMELAVMAILMAFVAAVPLGVISAVKQDTKGDYASRIFVLIGIAMPTFWVGILTVYALAYIFNWLPPLGYAKVWEDPLTNLQQLIFPALVLAFHDLAFTARVTRSSMLEVMREDYMRTARSKGLSEWVVTGRHALRNALLPVITVSGYQFGRLLGGVIIIEVIFVVPGVGSFLIDAIVHRDYVVLQAVVLLTAAVVLVLNLVIDLFYAVLDPRIRYG
ncbi:Putative peptide transport system permease protein BMEII0209 [Geodia barretti]|uniref:Peptide transport system permease protein BMEII0209 n=1 Tax=Geodia barretti TaxID=519541 RepID=A0AA35TEY0_GEOBA|nr:Putative peptide transport system permease protein BMEII0209 [Geodia barretti]